MPDRCTSSCQGSPDPWQNRDFSKCELWELMRELQGSISSQLEEFFQYPSNMILPLQMSNIWKNNFGSTAVTWLLEFLKCKFPIITWKCGFARGHLTPDSPRDIDQACVIYYSIELHHSFPTKKTDLKNLYKCVRTSLLKSLHMWIWYN